VFEPSTAKLDRHPSAADSPRARSPVTFFLAGEPDLDAARRLDPDRDLHAFRRGEFSWVVQTYLRLRAAGYPVELSSTPPDHGILVFHAKHRRALASSLGRRDGLVLVAIRADNRSPLIADFEILQNGRFASARRFAVPFWPQPRLLPREASRGTRLERVGYIGLSENLHPGFHSEAWIRDLRDAGFEWVLHAVDYRGTGDPSALGAIDWEDYRALDAIVAVRPDERGLASHKPANKLINAWRAGVPALAGAEFAFRELRRSEDDFLEVSSPGEALAALYRLRGDPARYSRMVSNGRQRAEEFSFAAIVERWARVLWEEIPRHLTRQPLHWSRALPLPLLLLLRRARRRLSPRIH
jgi:hypothetical protein